MKFVQIKSTAGLSWALLVDNEPDFMRFLEDKSADLYSAYKEAKCLVDRHGDATHGSTMAYVIACELEKHKDRKNVVDDVAIYSSKFLKTFIDLFYRDGKILVWQNTSRWQKQKYAGCMPIAAFDNHPMKIEIVKTVERDELIFPTRETDEKYSEKDISVSQWTYGNHYYAKIGKWDVVDEEGNTKWNTKQEAQRQAKIFLEQLNKNF